MTEKKKKNNKNKNKKKESEVRQARRVCEQQKENQGPRCAGGASLAALPSFLQVA